MKGSWIAGIGAILARIRNRFGTGTTSSLREPLLSKSKYLIGLQCLKALWINYHNKELLPDIDSRLEAVFDQGHRVGAWAKKLYPTGIDLEKVTGFEGPVRATQAALGQRKPIFEAAFIYNGCFSRPDILVPCEDGAWDIVEVKSSGAPDDPAELRDVYLQDLAFQRYVYEGAGLVVRSCSLLLINKGYVRTGTINPREMFRLVDATAPVAALLPQVPAKVAEMQRVLGLPAVPEVKVSRHCSSPYDCSLTDHCWSFLPQQSVFDLRGGSKQAWSLLERGVFRLADTPADVVLTERQARQISACRSNTAFVDRPAIRNFLSRLHYPLHFLDLETIQSAVPFFEKSAPFMAVPFQFSLHTLPAEAAPVQHHSFLAEGAVDPRPAFLAALQKALGPTGSIVGYNTAFEIKRLKDLMRFEPACANWVASTIPRFVDLYEVFRAMSFYHPSQGGSASLKAVLPALTGISYDSLEIGDGDFAASEFSRITFTRVRRRERQRVRRALEEYCAQDTQALIEIMRALDSLSRAGAEAV